MFEKRTIKRDVKRDIKKIKEQLNKTVYEYTELINKSESYKKYETLDSLDKRINKLDELIVGKKKKICKLKKILDDQQKILEDLKK